jgi:hypothetical protein
MAVLVGLGGCGGRSGLFALAGVADASGADAAGPEPCPPSTSRCGDRCVDIETDPSSCGGCGVVCEGECASGRCLSAIARAQEWAVGIAIDSTRVYWTNGVKPGGSVLSAPLDGGAPTVLASGQEQPSGIAVNATNVYWTTLEGVMTVPLGGGPVTSIGPVSGGGSLLAIAVDNARIYWTEENACTTTGCGAILSVSLEGGPVTTLASGQALSPGGGLAADGTHVFWATGGGIMVAPALGGAPTTLAPVSAWVENIAVDAASVYWMDSGGILAKVPVTGGAVTTLATSRGVNGALAVDATNVYWIDHAVMSVPLGGGAATTLFALADDAAIGVMAVGATSLYWTVTSTGAGARQGTGEILRLTPK